MILSSSVTIFSKQISTEEIIRYSYCLVGENFKICCHSLNVDNPIPLALIKTGLISQVCLEKTALCHSLGELLFCLNQLKRRIIALGERVIMHAALLLGYLLECCVHDNLTAEHTAGRTTVRSSVFSMVLAATGSTPETRKFIYVNTIPTITA